MSKKVASLVLAAGGSTRMGKEIKQLLPWGKSTLLGHAIKQVDAISNACYVVLGAHAETIRATLPENALVVFNPDWRQGIGSSIALGVSTILANNPKVDGILISLADQPMLDRSFYIELLNLYSDGDHGIVATSYGERIGVPAVFDKSFFVPLTALNQDFGARHIIQEHLARTLTVDPKAKAADIDTLSDYNQLFGNK